jgi:hypothetical protein
MTVFLAIEAVPDLLPPLALRLTMTASSSMRPELVRIAIGRGNLARGLYWRSFRLIHDIARGRWCQSLSLRRRKQRLMNIRGASLSLRIAAFINKDTVYATL